MQWLEKALISFNQPFVHTRSSPCCPRLSVEATLPHNRPSDDTMTLKPAQDQVHGTLANKEKLVSLCEFTEGPAEVYSGKFGTWGNKEGHADVDQLKAAYQDKITHLRKRAAVPGATAPLEDAAPSQQTAASIPFQAPPPPQPQAQSPPPPKASAESKAGIKTLSSYIDVEKMMALPQKEIEYIWRLRHANNPNSLCAVIPTNTYKQIQQTARKHPQFILPLPREGHGAEIHFLQWTFPSPTTATVLFTHLAEYKLRGEFSQPHTTVTHHLDLSDSKGLVLLQGSVIPDRGVTADEAKWLLMCLQKFYGQGAEETPRRKLMEQFSQGDGNFKVEELLEEAEKIS